MRILQLCHKPLFGKPDGGKIAMKAMADGLSSAGADLVQLMIETPQHPIDEKPNSNLNWSSIFIDTKPKYLSALWSLLKGESYNISRFNDKRYHKQLKNQLVEKYDVVLAEGIYTIANSEAWRHHSEAKLVLRTHNIEFLIWERLAEQENNLIRKYYLKALAIQLRKKEIEIFHAVDAIIAISDYDAEIIKSFKPKAPVIVIPIGTDLQKLKTEQHINDLFHLGAMDWRPNREGVDWFVNEIWKKLRKEFPDLRLVLAGKAMPEHYKLLESEGIQLEEVEDAQAFYAKHGVMIVPLLSGSGIRVKIIEGLALGKVIITTPQGAEGIPVQHGRELFVASTFEDYKLIINRLIESPALMKEISENACTFARENYRTNMLGQKTLEFLLKVI